MSEPLAAAILDLLLPEIRRLVREEIRRVTVEWRWLTTEEAGRLLGISAQAVRQRVRRGQLPAHRLEGRVYVDRDAVDHAIRNGR